MLCQFDRMIFPRDPNVITESSYMIALYRPCEKVVDKFGVPISNFKAVGYCLPTASNIQYDFEGHWSKSPKFGIQFEVDNYTEIITRTKDGIIAYLSSGQINGIGPKIAERIYEEFGDKTMEVLDADIDRLLTVRGISKSKLEKIRDSYLASRAAREVVAFLVPHGITAKRAVQFFRKYGNKTLEIVRNHPYKLCEIDGIGFTTADKIALNMGFEKTAPERVDEGIIYTLQEAENRGHLCMEKRHFIKECLKNLDTPDITDLMVASRAQKLINGGRLAVYGEDVYSKRTSEAESMLAKLISVRWNFCKGTEYEGIDAELEAEEVNLNIKMSKEQKDAVKTALISNISIITGGPGTGKTLIQKAILDIYEKKNPDKKICCCAPTGRAARRMSESTGRSAYTVHKVLGLFAGENGEYGKTERIEADLIIVDEVSMLDIYLAEYLVDAANLNAQIVLIGDADQLPSVGPGAVLSELISCGHVPCVRLDRVYRQDAGSRIAINAKIIRHGNLNLEYGGDFKFYNSSDLTESAKMLTELYIREADKFGVDNVALLCPFRKKTDTGVNALNETIREAINPKDACKPEIQTAKQLFRKGDKVMQVKNHEDVNNGDIGYIKDVKSSGEESVAVIDFGDGRVKEYDASDLNMLELGYATTIHKSQGSEYVSVIINIQCAHAIMLNRSLIYTAITRGKEYVSIVGERKALCMAIKKTDTEKRGTNLANRIKNISI